MSAKLYGIGVGPGDPELITLKAINIINLCDIIAFPKPEGSEVTAFKIIEKYIEGKETLECDFSMEKAVDERIRSRKKASDKIKIFLDKGKQVGFITLGDPSIYSTYMYINNLLKKEGYETEMIAGIPSFCAVSALLNISLCEGNEMLHIIPAGSSANLEEVLNLKGKKVFMKSGKAIKEIADILKNKDKKAKLVERCGLEGEKIYHNLDTYEGSGYFTIMITE